MSGYEGEHESGGEHGDLESPLESPLVTFEEGYPVLPTSPVIETQSQLPQAQLLVFPGKFIAGTVYST